jgi:hypothetical protein
MTIGSLLFRALLLLFAAVKIYAWPRAPWKESADRSEWNDKHKYAAPIRRVCRVVCLFRRAALPRFATIKPVADPDRRKCG